jgi:multicomponent Na+:H+ antiporter subunit A
MGLLFVVFGPALAALLLAIISRGWLARLTALVPLAIFGLLLNPGTELPDIDIAWIPSLNVSLAFFLDGLGRLFGLIISGIGTLVLLYAGWYFDDDASRVRFSVYTLLFMMAMLGIVLSDNLLLVFVFWEITSITSYLLIGFKHEYAAAREGARRALLVTGLGGLAMMAGFLIIGSVAGTFSLREILASGDALRSSPLYGAMLLLVLAGAFTKSAQWPFHFWLPGAMEAPTPASTYLHSATMVKAGVFLIARLSPALNETPLWIYTLSTIGLITFIYAAIIALRQTDLKAILAYSTVSWLGVLVAIQAVDSEYASVALVVGILGHAFYKGALFLVAGNVDHATGTRDIRILGHLRSVMPLTFIGALIAGLSMAGIPPLLGFLSKETLKAATLAESLPDVLKFAFPVAAVIGSALTVAVAFRIIWDTFFGNYRSEAAHHAHEVHPAMWLGPVMLGLASVALPFLIGPILDPLVNGAVEAITQQPASIHLHLFEGINTPLLMSALSIALGLLLFAARNRIFLWLQARREYNPVGVYHWMMTDALPNGAEWLTSRLQSGKLRYDMRIVIGSFIAMTLFTVIAGGVNLTGPAVTAAFDWTIALICLLLVLGAIAGVFAPTRLSAITVVGIEGALLSLLFAMFGAPDLAFTQLMIEVITLVLFVLAFHFLPDAFRYTARIRSRVIDLSIAMGSGLVITLLILAAKSNPVGESISPWYIENSVAVGQGHNVVNVILVDFRGLDTQGEIAVLIIAAMGVTALLRLRPSEQRRGQFLANSTDSDEDVDEGRAAKRSIKPMEGEA